VAFQLAGELSLDDLARGFGRKLSQFGLRGDFGGFGPHPGFHRVRQLLVEFE
jgi:hypothetical protein